MSSKKRKTFEFGARVLAFFLLALMVVVVIYLTPYPELGK